MARVRPSSTTRPPARPPRLTWRASPLLYIPSGLATVGTSGAWYVNNSGDVLGETNFEMYLNGTKYTAFAVGWLAEPGQAAMPLGADIGANGLQRLQLCRN